MKRLLAILGILLLAGCSRQAPQSEDQAISITNMFFRALVQNNYAEAYNLVADSAKKEKNLTPMQFEASYRTLIDENGPIVKAIFDSYQDVPKQNAIQVYYRIWHQKTGETLYHVVLEGSSRAGYKIYLLDVGNHIIYPPSAREKGKYPPRLKKSGVLELRLD